MCNIFCSFTIFSVLIFTTACNPNSQPGQDHETPSNRPAQQKVSINKAANDSSSTQSSILSDPNDFKLQWEKWLRTNPSKCVEYILKNGQDRDRLEKFVSLFQELGVTKVAIDLLLGISEKKFKVAGATGLIKAACLINKDETQLRLLISNAGFAKLLADSKFLELSSNLPVKLDLHEIENVHAVLPGNFSDDFIDIFSGKLLKAACVDAEDDTILSSLKESKFSRDDGVMQFVYPELIKTLGGENVFESLVINAHTTDKTLLPDYHVLMTKWVENDPNRAAEWLNKNPTVPHRDEFVKSFCFAIASVDYDAAIYWAKTLKSEEQQRFLLNDLRNIAR